MSDLMIDPIPWINPSLAYCIAELLLNENGEIEDYNLRYPYFSSKIRAGERIHYGILNLVTQEFENDDVSILKFNSAVDAENYLIEICEEQLIR